MIDVVVRRGNCRVVVESMGCDVGVESVDYVLKAKLTGRPSFETLTYDSVHALKARSLFREGRL